MITCSRHPFPENCPWEAGPREDHIQVDLADPDDTLSAIAEIKRRLENGELHALVNNAAISPGRGRSGRQAALLDRHDDRCLGSRVPGELLRARSCWRAVCSMSCKPPKARWSTSLRSPARASTRSPEPPPIRRRRRALASLTREMAAADFGPLRGAGECHRARRDQVHSDSSRPAPRRSSKQIPLHRLGTPDEVAKIIYVLCTDTSSYVNGAEIHINGGQHDLIGGSPAGSGSFARLAVTKPCNRFQRAPGR